MRKRSSKMIVNAKNLNKFLGVRKYSFGVAEKQNQIGQVTGLAWTRGRRRVADGRDGGSARQGQGDDHRQAGRSDAGVDPGRAFGGAQAVEILGVAEDFYQKSDLHIHLPEGAIPKDGPSAGIAIATALVSVLTGIPVRCDVAMTGEITLRGEVLPIGGLKEKLLAAVRAASAGR